MKCSKKVSDRTGFHFRPCGKPAKWERKLESGRWLPICGMHARWYRQRDAENVRPVASASDAPVKP